MYIDSTLKKKKKKRILSKYFMFIIDIVQLVMWL